jgi:hypothetical protein
MSRHIVESMQLRSSTLLGGPLKPGEIALAATYRDLCLEIATGDHPFVCVLEDDARLTLSALAFLHGDALAALPRFDVLRLGHPGIRVKGGYLDVARIGDIDVTAPIRHGSSSHAQIFSREGAAAAARGMVPLAGGVDSQLYDMPLVALRILETRPSVAGYADYPSTIQAPTGVPLSDAIREYRKKQSRAAAARARRHYRTLWGTSAFIRARTVGLAHRWLRR